MEICNGARNQIFNLFDGTKSDGTFQQISCDLDPTQCIDVDGWVNDFNI